MSEKRIGLYIIKWNERRYPNSTRFGPEELCIMGTLAEAEFVAKLLSDFYPGQDYMYYVTLNDDDDDD